METALGDGVRQVVIGVGINIRPVPLPPADPALAAAVAPGGLQELDPDLDAAHALLRIVPALVQTVQAFEQFGFAPFQARFALRDVLGEPGRAPVGRHAGHGPRRNGKRRVAGAYGGRHARSPQF